MTDAVKDVNQTEEPSTSEASTDLDIDEADLKAVEEEKHVPYNRFKEVNDEKNALKDKYDEGMQALKLEYEARLAAAKETAQPKEQESYEDYSFQTESPDVASLKETVAALQDKLSAVESKDEVRTLKEELGSLAKEFPQMDKDAVLGWKSANPGVPLRDLAERSHQTMTSKVEERIQAILEQKKVKKAAAIPTRTGGISLKADEKPKNIADAARMAQKWLSST